MTLEFPPYTTNTKDLIEVLESEFSNRFSYYRFDSTNTIYIVAFLIPLGKLKIESDQIHYKRPSGLLALISSTVRVLVGYADRMDPHFTRLETEITKFLANRKH